MGSRAGGGVRAGIVDGGGKYKGDIRNKESLVHIKDPKVYKEVKEAISRYEAVMGVRQRNVKLADMNGAYGAHVTSIDGLSVAVYLNKKYYNKSHKDFVADKKADYASGWSTKTNRPAAHTVTHELAHATWNSHLTAPKAKAAGFVINKLYETWSKDTHKKGYGKYATKNVNEFWAETVTKAVHGTPDRYTKAVKAIAKKYKL